MSYLYQERAEAHFMNAATGSVDTLANWRKDFEAGLWGDQSWEEAFGGDGLFEVVANVEGEAGYDPDYGEWRAADDESGTEKVLFWRSTSAAESFGAAFDAADVEFVEFASWDAFNAAGDIVEVESSCICYDPECPKRRYQDAEGRIYAMCLPEDMGGDIAEQIRHLDDKSKAAALADIEKYLREEGFYTAEANCIAFDDAPAWWLERCATYIADCFSDD